MVKFIILEEIKKLALQKYLEQSSNLHFSNAHDRDNTKSTMIIKNLGNSYLEYQKLWVASGQISKDYRDQVKLFLFAWLDGCISRWLIL